MTQSVNVSQGLKKFFFYLFLSGCLGLFGNHYIQKKLQQFWEPVALQLRQSGVELSPPQVVFSRHWLPVLGARIDQVRFEKDVQCFKGSVTVENVFVPFSIYQLLSQKLRIGEVEVENLKFEFIENIECASKGPVPEAKAEEALVAAAQKVIEKTETPRWFEFLDRWFTDREKILAKNPVSSLSIRSLSIDARSLEGKEITALGKAYINFNEGMSANIQLSPLVLRKKERSLSTEFTANINASGDSLQVLGDWAFHGGHFLTDLAYSKEQNIKVAITSRDLPVGVVNKWLDTPWSFQFLWFNCELSLEGKKENWTQIPWAVKTCRMNGPSGDITLTNPSLTSLKKPKEVSFKISQLDLDKIIYGRDQLPLSGVFKGFGQLQGQVDLKAGQWLMQMDLNNSQVVFSSENIRKLQTINKMNFTGGYDEGIYSLKLLSADIRNGEFDGSISAAYNARLGSGEGRVAVQKISFDESIDELMFAGQLSPLSANGDFLLDRKMRIGKAQGVIQFKEFKGTNLDLSGGIVSASWADKKITAQVSAQQAKILKAGTAGWVIGSLLNKTDNKDFLNLSRAEARGEVTSPLQVKLESLTATLGTLRLEASGSYNNKGMEGTWRWFEKESPLFQWKWKGQGKKILLIPQAPRMKEWLRGNPDFQRENPYIYLEDKDI